MEQKSHIQITRALLKNFSHNSFVDGRPEGRWVFYLDLKDNQIKEEKIRFLGAEEGYYSTEMEAYLDKNVEQKFGEIMKRARAYANGKIGQFTIDPVIIKTFYLYSILRSDYTFNIVKNLFPSIAHEEILLHPEAAAGAFSDYYANIFLNDTSVDFVIPKNCIYVAYQNDNAWIFLPIAPKVAFVLVQKNGIDGMYDKNGILAPYASSEHLIISLNEKAFEQERKWNNGFIVASRKIELEYLQNVVAS